MFISTMDATRDASKRSRFSTCACRTQTRGVTSSGRWALRGSSRCRWPLICAPSSATPRPGLIFVHVREGRAKRSQEKCKLDGEVRVDNTLGESRLRLVQKLRYQQKNRFKKVKAKTSSFC